MAAKKPKNDTVKHPWIARDGDVTPGKVSPKLKKANDELNEFLGLTKKKPAAKPKPKKK